VIQTPDIAAGEFTRFDNENINHQILVGEFAVTQPNLKKNTDTNWSLPFKEYPFWIGAVAEAIFYLGCERNTDKVMGVAYAPLLQNVNNIQWKVSPRSPSLVCSETLI
jgi:alpha-L-arabinofuranosidase